MRSQSCGSVVNECVMLAVNECVMLAVNECVMLACCFRVSVADQDGGVHGILSRGHQPLLVPRPREMVRLQPQPQPLLEELALF